MVTTTTQESEMTAGRLTGVAQFTGVVKDAVEELEADDGEYDDHEQHQQGDLQQRRHRLQDRLEHHLKTCNEYVFISVCRNDVRSLKKVKLAHLI